MADINTRLEALITASNEDAGELNSIIEELGGSVPVADVGDQPVFNTVSEKWTFAQSTANANGEYLGIYKLTSALFCSLLEALDIIAFTAPAAPNSPARLLPCGADPLTGWTNLPALVDLEGEAFNQFEIRSATPFEVRMRVAAAPEEWCAVFLDGTGLGNFVIPAPLPGYAGTHGSYDSADDALVATWQGEYFWGVMRWQLSSSVTVSQSGNHQLEWTGSLSASSISIATTAFPSGSARITRVEIEATGDNPFSGRDCP